MLKRLSRILRPSEKNSITPSRSPQRQLIQRQHLPPSRNNARMSRLGKPERRNGKLGDLQQTLVVRDGADHDDDLIIIIAGFLRRVGDDAGDGDGGAVDAGHEEAAEDYFVEGRVGSACLLVVSED